LNWIRAPGRNLYKILDLHYSGVRSGCLSKINQILEPSLIELAPIVWKFFWLVPKLFHERHPDSLESLKHIQDET
jgi:hypothetical protein